jgi:hypothetical protein
MSKAHPSRKPRKLTPEQVALIRSRYGKGFATIVALAAEFGISKSMVSLIIRGEAHSAEGVKRAPPRPEKVSRICAVCGKTFLTHPSEVSRRGGLFCSRACYHANRARPEAERFWEKVNKDGPVPTHCPELGPCWLWTGAMKHGKWAYGVLGGSIRGKAPKLAHRISWEIHNGPIPDNKLVLHRCDLVNGPCVNPDHLFLGTFKDNTRDMLAKRRHKVILTDEQAAEVRRRYAAGGETQAGLGREFGVSPGTIFDIVHRRVTY